MQFAALVHSYQNVFSKRLIAIVGGGGKSTLMQQLCREFVAQESRVIVTSTTKFQVPSKLELVLQSETPDYVSAVQHFLDKSSAVGLASEAYKDKNRLNGVSRQSVTEVRKFADVILVEADGSRQRPLKTHKEYEPPIPNESTHVIIICGAEVVGQALNDKTVHRAELFARKWDMRQGDTLTPEVVARELLSPYSYFKNIPIHANITIFINKADKNPIGAKLLAEKLIKRCDFPVFVGSLKKNQLQRIVLSTNASFAKP